MVRPVRGRVDRRAGRAILSGPFCSNAGAWRFGLLLHRGEKHCLRQGAGRGLHRVLLQRPSAPAALRRRFLESKRLVSHSHPDDPVRQEHLSRPDCTDPVWHPSGCGCLSGRLEIFRFQCRRRSGRRADLLLALPNLVFRHHRGDHLCRRLRLAGVVLHDEGPRGTALSSVGRALRRPRQPDQARCHLSVPRPPGLHIPPERHVEAEIDPDGGYQRDSHSDPFSPLDQELHGAPRPLPSGPGKNRLPDDIRGFPLLWKGNQLENAARRVRNTRHSLKAASHRRRKSGAARVFHRPRPGHPPAACPGRCAVLLQKNSPLEPLAPGGCLCRFGIPVLLCCGELFRPGFSHQESGNSHAVHLPSDR